MKITLTGRKLVYIVASLVIIGVAGLFILSYTQRDKYIHQAPTELPTPPLKELAERRGIQIGSFASLKYLRERPYSDLLNTQFEYLIIDGEPNWRFEDHELRPSIDTFDFADLDHVFEFADENDMPVRVQHLLWGDDKWLPDWLKEGNYTNEQLTGIIKNHIQTVSGRYKSKVREYTVVNEAFSRKLKTGGNLDWWGERMGEGYIDTAFITAREADPNAILILNDFGNETEGAISNLMYDYIKAAKARGVPIDGIGMQMHLGGESAPSKEDVMKNMRRFADLGVKVYVTEFDVNMHDVNKSKDEEEQIQANVYGRMLGACIEVGPDVCPNFGYLGLIDRQSWYGGIGLEDADPLMFDDEYNPKPAFFEVRRVLQENQ